MANYGGIGAGALSGAATGSALGPYGAAAGAVLGGVMGSMAGDGGAGKQQEITAAELQNALNQQQYAQALNTEAMRRSTAGSRDSQGNTVRYDPGTNTWVSQLGGTGAKLQSARNQADYLHNTVNMPQSVANNVASSIQASNARRGMSGAINSMNNYTPVTEEGLRGELQGATTRANQASQAPIIADTLRQFARTGSAAGPVLAQLERANAGTLANEMSQNVINSKTGTAQVNSANRASLAGPIAALGAAGTPSMQFPSSAGSDENASLAAQINGRAASSAQPATQGAAYSAYGTQGVNAAGRDAAGTAMNGPLPGELASMNQSVQSLGKSGAFKGLGDQINSLFGAGTYGPTQAKSDIGVIPNDPNEPSYNNGWR